MCWFVDALTSSVLDALRWLFGDTPFEVIYSSVLWAITLYLLYRWVWQPLAAIASGVMKFWKLPKTPRVFLEITPPKHSEKSPEATQNLFAILQKVIDKSEVLSLEIVSSREQGIRYLVCTYEADIPLLKRHLASFLPEVRFRVLKDTPELSASGQYQRVQEIKQTRHYGFPLRIQEDLGISDPIAYIAGSMTKLESGETIVMQMVLAPHYSWFTNRIYNKIMSKGYALLDHKIRAFLVGRWWVWLIGLLFSGLTTDIKAGASITVLVLMASFFIPKKEVALSSAEQQLYAEILEKLGRPLFRADIRVLVVANDSNRWTELANGVRSSLAPLCVPGYQKLYEPRLRPDSLWQRFGIYKLEKRLPSLFVFGSNVLATAELGEIFHFPYGDIRTEGMVRSHSRTLAAPLAIKNGEFDVVLGENDHHGELTDIGLTAKERERHVYIIGGTGNGKTTMLQYSIVQDIQNGKGIAVVDPHGDMAETILQYIPEDRIKDVIYFNPSDIGHPIGLNLLELPDDLTGDDRLLAQDFATEAVVSIFRKIFSEDDSGGHRIEAILRNAIHTAFTVEDATLFTIQKLLTNASYRKKVVSKLEDEDLKDFWHSEFGMAGNYQKVKMISGVTAKIGRFQRSVAARRILEQTKSTIDFDEILNGKILICNLSKGLVGEDTSELFGISILTKLQLAAYRRIHVKASERIPFYLYVDEFQNFASPLFMQMLSESRKYKMFLTMAEQSTSQQDERQMVETILANVGTVITFRSGNPADEQLVLPLFEPYIGKGEISNLPSFNFYMRIMGIHPQEPFSGETIVLDGEGSEKAAKGAVAISRKKNATRYARPLETKVNKRVRKHSGSKATGRPGD